MSSKNETRTAAFATREALQGAASRRSPTVDKMDFIVDRCRGKDVLDLGCINHSWETAVALGDNWLHHRISRVASSVVGLDLLEADAKILSQRGYDIRAGNAESFHLGKTFDVIIAGDLIEHLADLSRFLGCVREHMRPDSIFVVTTPNAFNVEQLFRIIALNRTVVNAQHSAWFEPNVAWELFGRVGMEIVDFRWTDTRYRLGATFGPRVQALLALPLDFARWWRPLLRRDFALVLRRAPDRAAARC